MTFARFTPPPFQVSGMLLPLVLMVTLVFGMTSNTAALAATPINGGTDTALGNDHYKGVETPQEAHIIALKNKLASEYMQVRAGLLSTIAFQRDWQSFMQQYGGKLNARRTSPALHPATTCQASTTAFAVQPLCTPPPSATVNEVQEPQVTYYYCGPAATMEVLLSLGVYLGPNGENLYNGPFPAYGERVLGHSYLGTDTNPDSNYWGTNWTDPDGSHPVKTTLNTWTNSSFYAPVPATGTGGFSQGTYQSDLITDVDIGYPLIGGVAEPSGQQIRLIGHPISVSIYHWIALEGYTSSGYNTTYADSIHNAYNGAYWIGGTSDNKAHIWSWESGVPAYSTVSNSSTMVPLLETFGYMW